MPAGAVQEPEPTVVIVTLFALAVATPRSRPSRVRTERPVILVCFLVRNLIKFFIVLALEF